MNLVAALDIAVLVFILCGANEDPPVLSLDAMQHAIAHQAPVRQQNRADVAKKPLVQALPERTCSQLPAGKSHLPGYGKYVRTLSSHWHPVALALLNGFILPIDKPPPTLPVPPLAPSLSPARSGNCAIFGYHADHAPHC